MCAKGWHRGKGGLLVDRLPYSSGKEQDLGETERTLTNETHKREKEIRNELKNMAFFFPKMILLLEARLG